MAKRRSPARWLAPLAIVACAVAVLAVVDQTIGLRADDEPDRGASATTRTTSTAPEGVSTSRAQRKRYRIKSGDVLSEIADRYGVTIEDLERLNPGLDPRALRVGRVIRLRR